MIKILKSLFMPLKENWMTLTHGDAYIAEEKYTKFNQNLKGPQDQEPN
jgi:hypothetical protein